MTTMATQENQHEKLALMTEEERLAMQQGSGFFNFGSDGEVRLGLLLYLS